MSTSSERLVFFAKYIEEEIGIIYSESNYFQLEHRLNDIVTLLGFSNLEELWIKAQNGISGQFRDLLLDVATNNETSFFRDPALFEAVVKSLIPTLKSNNPSLKKVHIWSAAGSTGQEACSISMAIEEAKKSDPNFPDFDVFVSDISDRVLKKAQEGIYTQLEVQRGLPTRMLLEYFEKEGDSSWRIREKIRDHLSFKKLNLLEAFPPAVGIYDIIFCRNVLIYQSVENKSAVVERLLRHLAPGGYLLLGAAESMLGISNAVTQLQIGSAVVYKKI